MDTKILLVEDHKIVRQGLCGLIEKQPDMEIVGQAQNGHEAIEMAMQTEPDIIIIDVGMPGINGIEATKQIKAEKPNIKILALSVHDDPEIVMSMVKAGISGYLSKDCAFDDLVLAIETILTEGSYLSPKIATIVLQEESKPHNSQQDTEQSIPLREHEIQVLRLLTDGKSAKQIAEMLNLSVKTIEGNRRKIMEKLNLDNFADLIKYAMSKGLVSEKKLSV